MYNNPYLQNYPNNFNQQSMNDRIDNQIAQLQQMKEQIKSNYNQQQHQPAINQTFQLAPNGMNTIKYASTIDEVNREVVYGDTPFFTKDMSLVWIKNAKGEIKTYELVQIINRDDKDIQIEYLQTQIEELNRRLDNERVIANANEAKVSKHSEELDKADGGEIKIDKPSSVSRISSRKKE